MNPTTESPPDGALVYTYDDVAAMLQVSRQTVGRMVKRGELHGIKFAPDTRRGAVRIPKWSVDQLLAQREERAA